MANGDGPVLADRPSVRAPVLSTSYQAFHQDVLHASGNALLSCVVLVRTTSSLNHQAFGLKGATLPVLGGRSSYLLNTVNTVITTDRVCPTWTETAAESNPGLKRATAAR